MLNELNRDNNVLDCSVNFNGNHVIQKILMNMGKDNSSLALKKFISEIEKDFIMLCQHENGCRVIQRMIDHCAQDMIKPIVDKVLSKYNVFIKDQYGTFVLCSILENGNDDQREFILQQVKKDAKSMGIDRDGSKLLENCIKMIGEPQTQGKEKLEKLQLEILEKVVTIPVNSTTQPVVPDNSFVIEHVIDTQEVYFNDLLTNKFGNYVVQTLYQKSNQNQRKVILQNIKKTMKMVHSIETTPLKHILKQINQKFGISQEEIEELSSDNSMGSLAERQFAPI